MENIVTDYVLGGELMRRCRTCGEAAPEEGKVCPACGKPFTAKGSVWKILAITGFVILVLAAAGVFGLKLTKQNQLQDYLSLGNVYLLDGDYAQAEQAFSQALKIDGGNGEARLGLAKSLAGLERYAEAEGLAKQIIEDDPANTDAYILLISMSTAKGDILEALQFLSQGEDKAGKAAFAGIRKDIDDNIVIQAEVLEADVKETVNISLLYSTDSPTILRPKWSIMGNGEYTVRKDGSGDFVAYAPGELKVTAAFGTIVREVTVVFTAKVEIELPMRIKDAEEFVTQLTYPFGISTFDNPGKLNNGTIVWLMINWLSRFSGEDLDYFPAQLVEQAAQMTFGPNLKELIHEELDVASWDSEARVYHIQGMGYDSVTQTYVLDCRDVGTQHYVEVVHLVFWHDYDEEEYQRADVYDEQKQYLGKYLYSELDSVLTEDYLAGLPKRRYVFNRLEDGSYHLFKSILLP